MMLHEVTEVNRIPKIQFEENDASEVILETRERKNIVFHIAGVDGFPQIGWQPGSGTFIYVENVGTKSISSTEPRKIGSGSTVLRENMRTLKLKDSSRIKFEVKHQIYWGKKTSVLGQTEEFTLYKLLEMQKQAGDDRDAVIELDVTFNARAKTPPPSPRSPKTPITPATPSLTPSTGIFLSVPSATLGTPGATSDSFSGKKAVLRINVRQTAVDPNHNSRATAANLEEFADKCRQDSLVDLLDMAKSMWRLRDVFGQNVSNVVCLIDIILGALEGLRKLVADRNTKNGNRNTVAMIKALNNAFLPYREISPRKLAKSGESSSAFMQEMLFGVVKAITCLQAFLRVKNDPYVKDKLEFKVTDWMRYFDKCAPFLIDESNEKPDVPNHSTSRRIHCPNVMVANPELPRHNMVPMTLPEVSPSETYNHPDQMRLVSEWMFSPSFDPPHLSSLLPQKQIRRPTPLNLIDEPSHPATDPSEQGKGNLSTTKPLSNVFHLSGASKSGKSQMVARMCEWLGELGCLGGYFSFDNLNNGLVGSSAQNQSRQLLDSLLMTLIHQAGTVEPDLAVLLGKAMTRYPSAMHDTLEKRFEILFLEPVKAFVSERKGAAWNPLDPLVFVVDVSGLVVDDASSSSDEVEDRISTTQVFVEWISSGVIGRLPSHVKFLVISRPQTGIYGMVKEGNAIGCEMGDAIRNVAERVDGVDGIETCGIISTTGPASPISWTKGHSNAYL